MECLLKRSPSFPKKGLLVLPRLTLKLENCSNGFPEDIEIMKEGKLF